MITFSKFRPCPRVHVLHRPSRPMLPRHLQSLVRANAYARARNFLVVTPQRRIPLPTHSFSAAGFHSSSRRQNELPKSPFQTFVEVLRDEIRKNRELQDNVKQLQGDVQQFQDSEAMKRARDMYERARVRNFTHSCVHDVDLLS